MILSKYFSRIRESSVGKYIRSTISDWPSYQQLPSPNSIDFIRCWTRALLSVVSGTLTQSEETKLRIRATSKLRYSESGSVLLIGNGPSSANITIRQVESFRRSGGKIAVMNSYFRSDLSRTIVPDYYFIVDPDYWFPRYKSTIKDGRLFRDYVLKNGPNITIVQPADRTPLVEGYLNYLYIDGRSAQGIFRFGRPDKPWGLAPAVALYSIGTLKFLGFSSILFSGLDSNFINFFSVNELNQVINKSHGMHFYGEEDDSQDALELIESNGLTKLPFQHLADLHYGHGIFLRDFYSLCQEGCINVGNDTTNDAAPRACLLPPEHKD